MRRTDRTRADLAVGVAVSTTAAVPVFLVAALAVNIRDSLRFTTGELGVAVSLYYLGAAASLVPFSRLTDRLGGVRVMRLASGATALLLLLIGWLTRSWVLLAILLLASGMANAAAQPATTLFLAKRTSAARHGLVFGIKQAAVPLASTIGGLAVPIAAVAIGWRWSFIIAGAVALVACAAVPSPRTTMVERRRTRQGQAQAKLALPALSLLAAGLGLGFFAASGLVTFLTSSGVATGLSKGMAGVVAACAGGAAVVVRIATGGWTDRHGSRHFHLAAIILAVGGVGYLVLALSTWADTVGAFGPAAVIALGFGWGWTGLFMAGIVRAYPDTPARATSVTQVGGRIGGVLGPITVGVIISHTSFADAWAIMALVALLSSGMLLLGHRALASREYRPDNSRDL